MSGANFVTPGFVPNFVEDGILESAVSATPGVGNSTTVVPAVSGKRILVYALALSASAACGLQLADVTTGGSAVANQTGVMNLAAGVPLVLPYSGWPWASCAPGDALVITQTVASTALGGRIVYSQG